MTFNIPIWVSTNGGAMNGLRRHIFLMRTTDHPNRCHTMWIMSIGCEDIFSWCALQSSQTDVIQCGSWVLVVKKYVLDVHYRAPKQMDDNVDREYWLRRHIFLIEHYISAPEQPNRCHTMWICSWCALHSSQTDVTQCGSWVLVVKKYFLDVHYRAPKTDGWQCGSWVWVAKT